MLLRVFQVISVTFLILSLFIGAALSQKKSTKTLETKKSLTILVGLARILDGDTLEIHGKKVRLHGIDAPENAQKCFAGQHDILPRWRCGKTATNRLIEMTDGQDVSCKLRKKDDFGRWIAECFVSDINLNRQMVLQGMAWAFRKYSADFIGEERQAKERQLGIWKTKNETAWAYRAKKWQVAETQVAPNGCAIKGNISYRNKKKQKIYHLPWFRSYKRTSINLKKGEKWFCSEQDAQAAGWRRAYKQ